jgi:hypothetical protein
MPVTTPPTPADPAVRASHLKEDLAALASLGADLEERVLRRISPGTLAVIQDATRVDWLPVELNVELAEAVFGEAGESVTRAWARASFQLSLNAFFKPLLETVLRLFDPTPHRIYAFVPRAWPAVYRNAGVASVIEQAPHESRVTLQDLPPTLMNDAFLRAVAGTFECALELAKVDGRVTVLPWTPGARTATWAASWQRRSMS